MNRTHAPHPSRIRLGFAAAGVAAGGFCWVLFDTFADRIGSSRSALFALAAAAVFFAALIAILGPLRLRDAAVRAGGIALVVAALVTLASLRYDAPTGLLDDAWAVLAAGVLATLPLPFSIVLGRSPRGPLYPPLFDAAWGIVLRFSAAWTFAGLVWLVILLANLLFTFSGIDALDRLIGEPLTIFAVTGGALGLALAVIDEMAAVVSPGLVLRLLRILVPVVLAVGVVFLGAFVTGGADRLETGLSPAGILLAMAFVSAALVSAAVDTGDARAVAGVPMVRATQALCLVMLGFAGIAVWAIGVRVAAFGWTPARLAAATLAAVTLLYGAGYVASVLGGRAWMARLRRVNTGVALAAIAVAALWLTPLLDANRISAASQVARFDGDPAGPLPDVETLRDDWGRAGAAAYAALEARAAAGDARLAAALAARRDVLAETDLDALRADLAQRMPVLPAGRHAFATTILRGAREDQIRDWSRACRSPTPAGNPGCAMVIADFRTDAPGPEAMVLVCLEPGFLYIDALAPRADGTLRSWNALRLDATDAAAAVFDALAAGKFATEPAPFRTLVIGGVSIVLAP